ncbi:MAG: exodeoxyribonuclease VII large subunit, partial [Bacteroidia bacterium]
IKNVLKQNFSSVYWVVGEIAAPAVPNSSGNIYTKLVEKGGTGTKAEVRLSIFAGSAYLLDEFTRKTGMQFTNGADVLVKVKVDLHEKWGFCLVLKDIDYSYTIAKVQDERQKTLLKLEKEKVIRFIEPGKYQTFNNQLKLNAVVQRIALISAKNSEGYNDFVKVLDHNSHNYKFKITDYFASMAGDPASKSIIAQLNLIGKQTQEYDAVAIVRGGGDDTGFVCYDDFELSKSVANFPLPIITGIGHERNKCIIDMVANTFTITPTMAAKVIVDHNWKFEQRMIELGNDAALASKELLSEAKTELKDLESNLNGFVKDLISEEKTWLEGILRDLKNFSPDNTLARGFAIISLDGKILKDTKLVKTGSKLKTITKSDLIESSVTKIEKRKNGEIKL